MRRHPIVRRATFIAAALLTSQGSALAADFEHRLLARADAAALAGELNRAGAAGFRLSALVDRADDLAALVARPRREPSSRYEYAVLAAKDAASVPDLGKRGFAWRASATSLGWGGSVVVLEHAAGDTMARDLQVVESFDVAALERRLAEPFANGFRVVGRQSFARQKAVWIVLERAAGGSPHEVRVVAAEAREKLERALADAASQGYALETFWAQPAGPFRRDTLVAVVARAKGSTAPAAHCKVEEESRSIVETSARLVALDTVDQGRTWLAAWCPGRVGQYWSRDIDLERPSGALFGTEARVEHELASWNTGSIPGAYLLREHEQPAVLVAITLDTGVKLSTPEVSKVKKLAPPAGGTALPADGGELLRLYTEMYRLYHAKKLDPTAVRLHWSAKVLAKVGADVKEMGWPFKERDMLEHQGLPFDGTDPRYRDGWVAGDRGMVRIDAVHDGLGSLIEIRCVREGGVWKIDDWGSWDRVAP